MAVSCQANAESSFDFVPADLCKWNVSFVAPQHRELCAKCSSGSGPPLVMLAREPREPAYSPAEC